MWIIRMLRPGLTRLQPGVAVRRPNCAAAVILGRGRSCRLGGISRSASGVLVGRGRERRMRLLACAPYRGNCLQSPGTVARSGQFYRSRAGFLGRVRDRRSIRSAASHAAVIGRIPTSVMSFRCLCATGCTITEYVNYFRFFSDFCRADLRLRDRGYEGLNALE